MATKIINATGSQTSFNYSVGGTRLYFNYYITYEEPAGAGTINPSTLSTTLLYQKQKPGSPILHYVQSAIIQPDGTWKYLKENEARVIYPPGPGNLKGSIGPVFDPNSTKYVLGDGARQSLAAQGPNTLNYAARQNAAAVVAKATSLTLNQVNQASFISGLSPAQVGLATTGAANTNYSYTGIDFNPTIYTSNEKATPIGKILVYPRDHGEDEFDFISIQPIEYVPQFTMDNLPKPTESGFAKLETVKKRISIEKATGPKIYLPMTPGISETNSVGWGEDSLNAVQLALGNKAMGIISDPRFDPATAFDNLGGIAQTIKDLANSPGLKNYITAYFAGQAVQANLQGRSGIVINPNLELLFQGPKLRSFKYSFKFTPRDSDEAKIIRAIIKTLKKTMAVRRSQTSIFLGVPSVYKIKYIYGGKKEDAGKEHPFLNKIKPCALTTLNVNYTPDGSYMTYNPNPTKAEGGGSMTSYTVDMQFDELEPIYNEDINNINEDTMGY